MEDVLDLIDGIKNRRAIRRFKKDKISKKTLEKIFENAKWSPVSGVFRHWEYLVLQEEKRDQVAEFICKNTELLRDLIYQAYPPKIQKNTFNYYNTLGNAPVIILITIPKKLRTDWDKKYLIIFSSTELQNLLLSIYEAGLGACGITLPPEVEKDICEFLDIKDREILTGIAVGYPNEKPKASEHRRVSIKYYK